MWQYSESTAESIISDAKTLLTTQHMPCLQIRC